jgi:hypothetical protein
MKTTCGQQWLFVATALALSGVRATADDANVSEPLIQARFDQLIPTSYPTLRPSFERLIQTTLPLTDPGIARVPITENLVHPLDQQLLIVNEGWGQLPGIRPKRESIPGLRQTSASRHAQARSGGKAR